MTTLTESIVLSRSRAEDLYSVRKLNCWGSELGDVSLVRSMKNVEVLSLSVNKIKTLADFAHCPNLQELYIRKNEISKLTDVLYLKDLKKLKSLWLADNPCATADHYRLTVIKYLPELQKLDNIVVKPDEVQNAMLYGHSLDEQTEDGKSPSPPPRRHSTKRIEDDHEVSLTTVAAAAVTDENRNIPKAVVESMDEPNVSEVMRPERQFSAEDAIRPFEAKMQSLVEHASSTAHHQPVPPANPMEALVTTPTSGFDVNSLDGVVHTCAEGAQNGHHRHSVTLPPGHSPYAHVGMPRSQSTGDHRSSPPRSFNVRGKNRNSNILSAILCLIKELDYANLEVVETAVQCRMMELEAYQSP